MKAVVEINTTKARPRVRLRLLLDPDMGAFYDWCVSMPDRVRAREVLMAARFWHGSVRGGGSVGAQPQAVGTPGRVRLRLSLDPDMGAFYDWCVSMPDRVRAREVLMAARFWHESLRGGGSAGALPQAVGALGATAPATPTPIPQREPIGTAAGVGRKFATARPRREDMQA